MYRIDINWLERVERGENPIPYILMETGLGCRAFGRRDVSGLTIGSGLIADGGYLADGSIRAGEGFNLLSFEARVVDFGRFNRTIKPGSEDLLTAFTSKQQADLMITLSNADNFFTMLAAREPLLGRRLFLKLGFMGDIPSSHLSLFTGVITETRVSRDCFIVTVEEDQGALNSTHFLKRAGMFASPLNTNDRLPVVYGDLTDGSTGVWRLPLIDTINHVYAYAGHPVLSEVLGNAISVYVDGVLQTGAGVDYTFLESDPAYGHMATVTFTATRGNAVVSARGQGKAPGGMLMENIILILEDFLWGEVGWAGEFEPTALSEAIQAFEAEAYRAAGVIEADAVIWKTIQQMMASFLGAAYINGQGQLVVEIDRGVVRDDVCLAISGSDIKLESAVQTLDSVINQVPVSFSYSYAAGEFLEYDQGVSTMDAGSQSVHGLRTPREPYAFYWCRQAATVRKIQQIIVGKLKEPLWLASFQELSSRSLHLDIGDTVSISFRQLVKADGGGMINQIFKIVTVNPDFDADLAGFSVLDTGMFLTTACPADGGFTASGQVKAGGDRDITDY